MTIVSMTELRSIIDLTDREQTHSDSSLDIAAHRTRECIAVLPPAPTKYNRRQRRSSVCQAKPILQEADYSCIKAMRRHICEQIYDSELCPVIGEPGKEDLWASFDGMFIQLFIKQNL